MLCVMFLCVCVFEGMFFCREAMFCSPLKIKINKVK